MHVYLMNVFGNWLNKQPTIYTVPCQFSGCAPDAVMWTCCPGEVLEDFRI